MIKVFHADPTNFDGKTPESFPEGYTHVADLELMDEDLGFAFQLTNHIDSAWDQNNGVISHVKSRSSSVGDVFVTEDGKRHIIKPVGLEVF